MAKTWVKKGNLKGPKGDLADWKRAELTPGYDIFDLYGADKVGLYSCNLASTTPTILNLPQDLYDNPAAFTVTVKTLNNGVVLQLNTYSVYGDAEYICNSAPSTGTGWTAWKRYLLEGDLPEQKPQERGYKTVPLALTLPAGSSDTETVAAGSLRFPMRYATPLYRARLHVQNINDRGGQSYSGAISFTGLWFGPGNHTTGAFTGTPTKVMDAFSTPANGSEYVGPWMNLDAQALVDYFASVGYTNTAGQQNTLSLGAVWRSSTPGNASVTAPAQTQGTAAPFSIWMEVEVPEATPVVAELGSSGAAGAGSTLPILESALSIYARRIGALPLHYAHSGSTLAIWDEADHHKWQKWQDYARPDAMLVSLGSNDVYGSETLDSIKASAAEVLEIAKQQATTNIYATTIPPRATGDETKRRQYNTWLRTLPLGIRDVFDWSAAVSNDDETIRPEFDADGIHTNTAGAQAKADATTRAVIGHMPAATAATIGALPAASIGNRGLIVFVTSEDKPYYSNGTVWAPISAGAQGVPGPPGPGVPAGGSALQLVRKNSANTATEWATPDKAMVGLGFVDNTADANKPVSGPQQSALAALFSGIVIAAEPSGVDDTVALNALLASGAGKTVQLKAGRVYKTTDSLTVPTGTTFDLNGAMIDATGIPAGTTLGQRIAIKSAGSLGADVPITTAVAQWSRTVAGVSSTTGLSAGDLVLISNGEFAVPGLNKVGRNKGELNVIQSVDAGAQTITLVAGALFDYGTTGLKLRKVSPVENVTIKGGSILLGGIASAHSGIEARYGRNVTIRDVIIDGAEDIAVGINTVWNGKVQSCTLKNSTSSTTLGNTGYGVAVVEGSRHVVVDGNHFDNCRHFVAGGGYWPAVFVDVTNNQGQRSSNAAYDCHESCFYWTFTKNTAVSVESGFIIRGQYITVDDNEITDSLGRAYRAATFDGVTEQRGIRIINNKATQCAYGIEVDGQAAGAEPNCLKSDIEISGNTLRNAGLNPILLRHFDGAEVSENKVFGSTGHAILLLGLAATQSKNLTANDNTVRLAGLDAIKVQYVDDVKIATPDIAAPGNYGIQLLNCNRTTTTAPGIRTPGFSGMSISGGAVHSVVNPMISGGASTSYDAIRVTGTAELSITGGYLGSARWAIYTTTTDHVVITGVNCRGGFTAGRISCDAANKVVVNNLVT